MMLLPTDLLSVILFLTLYISSVFGAAINSTAVNSTADALDILFSIMSNDKCNGDSRFPALTPAKHNLNPAQAAQYNYLVTTTKKVYGNTIITVDPDGSLQGPFGPALYAPSIVPAWTSYQLAVGGNLPAIENEAAVLGVLSVNKARYGIYAHTIIAQKAGYTALQVKSMLAGIIPLGITPRQAAIYTLAVKMVQLKGPLDSPSFNAALLVLGRDDIASAVQQIAAFVSAAMLLNVGDVCLPEGV